jgi:hypothetical protein
MSLPTGRDVHLSDDALAEARAKLAFVTSLGADNAAVRDWIDAAADTVTREWVDTAALPRQVREPDLTEAEQEILAVLRKSPEPLFAKHIATEAQCHIETVKKYLRPGFPLRAHGLVEHTKLGYRAARR